MKDEGNCGEREDIKKMCGLAYKVALILFCCFAVIYSLRILMTVRHLNDYANYQIIILMLIQHLIYALFKNPLMNVLKLNRVQNVNNLKRIEH